MSHVPTMVPSPTKEKNVARLMRAMRWGGIPVLMGDVTAGAAGVLIEREDKGRLRRHPQCQ